MTEETKIINAPDRIWLQIGDDFEPGEVDFAALEGVTWCQDNIHGTDIEYVRVPPGYKLVPIDPTDKMVDAACPCGETVDHFDIRTALRAAIAAAPTESK
jgi:hypothetical protein